MFHAEIEATNHCNTRCIHCPLEPITRTKGRMSSETFVSIIAKISRQCQRHESERLPAHETEALDR